MFLILLFLCMLRTGLMVTHREEGLMVTHREELLLEEPSKWPGHLEPFGSQQYTDKIEELYAWPDPMTFFKEYVDKSKPVLFKGMGKQSPAYVKFHDGYFANATGADETIIYAEPEMKENRTKKGFDISIKEFIKRYHNESLYMVNALPKQFCSDVRMPAPLRCENTKQLMASQVTWFSSGGTKSLLHNDDVDNINCLFRGSKQLWMIEYGKNKLFVPIDQLQGGYSSLDVEKVNYTMFPELRKVEVYYKAVMEEGDCLYIPYHWFHQVNSFADDNGMNLAVNIWFRHEIGHNPGECNISESDATIDKYVFPDDEEEKNDGGKVINRLASYVPLNKSVSLKFFLKQLKRDRMVNPTLFKLQGFPDVYKDFGKELFTLLDINEDGRLSAEDFEKIDKLEEDKYSAFEDTLNSHIAAVENYFEDLMEEYKKAQLTDSVSSSQPHTDKEEL